MSNEQTEALKPFADLADWIDANRPQYANPAMEVQVENWPYTLSVGWLYAARKALAATSPSTDTLGWQDIASAPKDGTGILVVDMKASDPGAGMAWFINGEWCGDDPEVLRGADDCRSCWPSPTHWMPLPNLPNTGGSHD